MPAKCQQNAGKSQQNAGWASKTQKTLQKATIQANHLLYNFEYAIYYTEMPKRYQIILKPYIYRYVYLLVWRLGRFGGWARSIYNLIINNDGKPLTKACTHRATI